MAISDSTESIPGEDGVSRAFFRIPGEVDPESQFIFAYDRDAHERAESVFWRKYAPALMDIHERGCRIESIKNRRSAKASKPQPEYIGSRTTMVATIIGITSGRGHKFAITHKPENEDLAHAHVSMKPAGGASVEKLPPNDRRELIHLLFQVFGNLEPHHCSREEVYSTALPGR